MGFAEAGLVGAHIIEGDFLGIALLRFPAREEQHICLDALGIENTGGQAKNGMQITEVHQFAADAGTVSADEQNVIRHYNSTAGIAVRFQAAIDYL